jgi:hypothetical protein
MAMQNNFLSHDTKKRVSYLFNDSKDSVNCDSFKDHKDHISKFLNCVLKKPLLSDRILKNYSIVGRGCFGKVFKSDMILNEDEKESYTVVLKENINYIEDINEIFINQVRINQEILYNNNPNFPIMISYILCNPIPEKPPLCQESIIDVEEYSLDEINKMLKKNVIKLYGIYEYINGKTLANYISTLKFFVLNDLEKWIFIKNILIQVFSALHCLNKLGKYTHCDLHMGNIMITEENLNHTYELNDSFNLNINNPFKCCIIDQGLANAEYDGNYFIYQNNSLNRPFLDSFDIFKLLLKLYIALAIDNMAINKLYCKKLRSLLKILFNNSEKDTDFIINYIESNTNSVNGDVTLYYNYLLKQKNEENKEDIDIIHETILNISYNDFVRTLLAEEEILDISKEMDLTFKSPYKQDPSKPKKIIPIIIKGRK